MSALSRASTREAPGASAGWSPSTAPRAMSAMTTRWSPTSSGSCVAAAHQLERPHHALEDQRVRLGAQVLVRQGDQVADPDDLRLAQVDRGPPEHRAGQVRLHRGQPGRDRGPGLLVGADHREGLVARVGHHDLPGELLEPDGLGPEVHVLRAQQPHRVVVRRHGEAVRPGALAGEHRTRRLRPHASRTRVSKPVERSHAARPGTDVELARAVEGVEEVGEVRVAEGVRW